MTKQEALKRIKTLRDAINTTTESWVSEVLFHLDAASDVIESDEDKPE